MMSHRILGIPAVLANQRVSLCQVIAEAKWREFSNVGLPTMGKKRSFIQLIVINRPTPCITLLGLESDN